MAALIRHWSYASFAAAPVPKQHGCGSIFCVRGVELTSLPHRLLVCFAFKADFRPFHVLALRRRTTVADGRYSSSYSKKWRTQSTQFCADVRHCQPVRGSDHSDDCQTQRAFGNMRLRHGTNSSPPYLLSQRLVQRARPFPACAPPPMVSFGLSVPRLSRF